MVCENIQQYDFCTIKGHEVPLWKIKSLSFTETMSIKIFIYNQFDALIETIIPEQKTIIEYWWNAYTETKKPALYKYIVCLLDGDKEIGVIKRGEITVQNHV